MGVISGFLWITLQKMVTFSRVMVLILLLITKIQELCTKSAKQFYIRTDSLIITLWGIFTVVFVRVPQRNRVNSLWLYLHMYMDMYAYVEKEIEFYYDLPHVIIKNMNSIISSLKVRDLRKSVVCNLICRLP